MFSDIVRQLDPPESRRSLRLSLDDKPQFWPMVDVNPVCFSLVSHLALTYPGCYIAAILETTPTVREKMKWVEEKYPLINHCLCTNNLERALEHANNADLLISPCADHFDLISKGVSVLYWPKNSSWVTIRESLSALVK
jgi:5'(3')-deoxyribonucleotidase